MGLVEPPTRATRDYRYRRFDRRSLQLGVCYLWALGLEPLILTKTNQIKRPKKQTLKFSEGPKAHQDFEKAMKALFQAPKTHKKAKD